MSENKHFNFDKRCNRVKTGPRHTTFNHPNRLFRKTLSQDEFKTFLGSDASNSTCQNKSSHHLPLSSNHNKQSTSTMKTKASVQKKSMSSHSNLNAEHNTSQVSSVTHQSVKLNAPSSSKASKIPGNTISKSSNSSYINVQSNLSQNSKPSKSNRSVVTDEKTKSLDAADNQGSNRTSGSTHLNQKSTSMHKTPMLKTASSTAHLQEPANFNSFHGDDLGDDDNDNHLSAKRSCNNRLSFTMSSKKSRVSDVSSSIASNSNDLQTPQIGSRLSLNQFPDCDIPVSDEGMTIESVYCKVAELERKVQYLSTKVDKYEHELSRGISSLGSSQHPRKELSPFLHGIVIAVVKELFKSVKFLDNKTVLHMGDKIVTRFLQKSNQDAENIHDKSQYNAVIHKARKILSIQKCHVKANIRSATADLLLQDNGAKIGVGELWFVHVNYFRVGHFSNASRVVQSAWIQFCKSILIHVNKAWKDSMTQQSKLVSSVCTLSDEAFAIQVGKTDMHSWLQKYVEKKKPKYSKVVNNIHPLPYSTKSNFPVANTSDDDDDDDNTPVNEGTNGGDGLGDENEEDNDNEDDMHNGDVADDDAVDGSQEGNLEDEENENGGDAEADDNQDGDNKGEDNSKDRKKNDRINETEYHDLVKYLLSLKKNNHEDWLSWDQGYKSTIEDAGDNSNSSKTASSSSVPSQINVGEPEMFFEDW